MFYVELKEKGIIEYRFPAIIIQTIVFANEFPICSDWNEPIPKK